MQAYNLDRSGQKTDVSIAADSPEFSLVPLELVWPVIIRRCLLSITHFLH